MDNERQRLQQLKPNLQRRAAIFRFTRSFFTRRGFLEVETPVRVECIAPEQFITPFRSEDWYLSTSPELHMKRLIASGYEKLFQISHCFRQGERGRLHNPEFTMIEWYRTGAGYLKMMSDTEELVNSIARGLHAGTMIIYQGNMIDITPPWPRITVRDAFLKMAGWDPVDEPDPVRFDTDLVDKVIPGFDIARPTILLDYPAPMASLARLKPDNPRVAERAEVFIAGLELANAFSELNNPEEQKKRFQEEAALIEREQGRRMTLPGKFLDALSDLPECGGIALGMDRLVMLFCDARSIDEVVAFTVDNI